jgi:hypothetical protein
MSNIASPVLLLWSISMVFSIAVMPAIAQDLSRSVCEVVIYDENSELEESRLAVDLAKSNYESYTKIFKMIEGLWEGKTIPRMDYVEARHDQDAARLELEKSGLMLERQAALVEQYRLICDGTGSDRDGRERAIREAYLRYRRADCGSLAKGIEVAGTNLEFYREYLMQIQKLREEKFATNTQVVLAQLDVEREEKSLEDAKRRTSACRDEMSVLDAGNK